jgi:hypothetical protein
MQQDEWPCFLTGPGESELEVELQRQSWRFDNKKKEYFKFVWMNRGWEKEAELQDADKEKLMECVDEWREVLTRRAHLHNTFFALQLASAVAACDGNVHSRMEIMYRHEEKKEKRKNKTAIYG